MRTQFVIVIALAGILSYTLFSVFWWNKWHILSFIDRKFSLASPVYHEEYWEDLAEEALKYDIPESEEDKEGVKKIQPFFEGLDEYTGLYIYGMDDGLYRAGVYPGIMDNSAFATLYSLGVRLTGGEAELRMDMRMTFKNGTANVVYTSFHNVRLLFPYCIILLIFCIGLFLFIVLFFVSYKMKTVIRLKDHVLRMSTGDFTQPIPPSGQDEIGILSQELNHLRIAFRDTLLKEQESQTANRELITAMSHDLRTPLTILEGYLEILKLKKNPDMEEEYLNRCLGKTEDIKKMTDRMFEYALVFEEPGTPELLKLPVSFLRQCLLENCDFIRLTGFMADLDFDEVNGVFLGDESMVKRIFSNLFSNIIKYGDKKEDVTVTGRREKESLSITCSNKIKKEHSETESSRIGLKSVEKMMTLMQGTVTVTKNNLQFTVRLTFPFIY